MAIIWVRPQGSNMEGTRIRSQAAARVTEGDMMAGREGLQVVHGAPSHGNCSDLKRVRTTQRLAPSGWQALTGVDEVAQRLVEGEAEACVLAAVLQQAAKRGVQCRMVSTRVPA